MPFSHRADEMSDGRLILMVCRGCCCGTGKHPEVDHEAQLRMLDQVVDDAPGVELAVTGCLGPCGHSNVIRVRELDAHGPRDRIWFGGVCTPESTALVAGWLVGGASADRLPAALARHRLRPDPRIVTPDDLLEPTAAPPNTWRTLSGR
jgi:hypothetical protein